MEHIRTTFLTVSALFALSGRAQGTIDNTFTVGTGASARVITSVMQNDGKMVIGGAFVTYNGTARNRVARVLREWRVSETSA